MKRISSLRVKLLAGFVALASLSGGLGLYAKSRVSEVANETRTLNDEGIVPLREVSKVQHLLDDGVTQGTSFYYFTQLAMAGVQTATTMEANMTMKGQKMQMQSQTTGKRLGACKAG